MMRFTYFSRSFLTLRHFIRVFDPMSRPQNPFPTYLKKFPDAGRIYWRGETRDLPGKYRSPESLAEYHRLCEIVRETGELPPLDTLEQLLLIKDLCKRYHHYLKEKHGKTSNEPIYISYALRALKKLCGNLPVSEFGPAQLRAVRGELLAAGYVRRTCNKRIQQLVRMFRWAVSEDLAEPSQWQRLQSVEPVAAGQFGAIDRPRKRPVSDAHYHLTLEHASFEVTSALRVLALTGMRTGELLQMRPQDVDMTGTHWIYRPQRHKTQAKTGDTLIAIPAVATQILIAHMPKSFNEPWFPYCSSWLRNAVKRICQAHDIPLWHPHQLRHRFVTKVANAINEKAAQTLARHHDPKMTDHYTARDALPILQLMDQLPADLE